MVAHLASQGSASQKKQKMSDASPTPSTPGTTSSRYNDDDVDDKVESPSKDKHLKTQEVTRRQKNY